MQRVLLLKKVSSLVVVLLLLHASTALDGLDNW
jgi:hypothetical protein